MYRFWADETQPPSRSVFAEFRCDGDHGLLPTAVLTLDINPDEGGAWTQAVAAGWLVLPARQLCPECRAHRVNHPNAQGD